MSSSARKHHIMSGFNATAAGGPYHPQPGTNSATLYGGTATEADNVFASGSGEGALIHEIRVDKNTAILLTLRQGPINAGSAAVMILQSSVTCDAVCKGPFFIPTGFHLTLSGTGNFTITYEII